jgi:hypothetical protein
MVRRAQAVRTWLDTPLPGWACVLGWCSATAAFIVVVKVFGGPGPNDTYESVFSTWAIAHGQLRCAFPTGYREIAPVYPLFSGALSAIDHAGSGVRFPVRSVLGPHCDRAFLAINQWGDQSGAVQRTVDIGYSGWIVLLAGVVSLLRSCGRGGRGWEPATVCTLALVPAVWMCLGGPFHPQDLFAMGFILAALACSRRSAWALAGVFIALAVLSQQFALLVAVPLLIVAPGVRKLFYGAGAAGAALVVTLPLLIANTKGTVHAVVFGTGTTGGIGGTILWEFDLQGVVVTLLSRVAPIAIATFLAWWTVRRIGPAAAMRPGPLMALLSVCLSLRLVFEQQLFGYYFMALTVALLLLDVVRGHLRSTLAAWLATTSMVFLLGLGSTQLNLLRSPWVTTARDLIALAVILLAGLFIVRDARRAASHWRLALWVGVIAAALLSWATFNHFNEPPTWLWQVLLVPPGIALAAGPLLAFVRAGSSAGERPSVATGGTAGEEPAHGSRARLGSPPSR